MLISDSHKFIFFHYPKTAGTSMTFSLAPYTRNYDKLPEVLYYKMHNHYWQAQSAETDSFAIEKGVRPTVIPEFDDVGHPLDKVDQYRISSDIIAPGLESVKEEDTPFIDVEMYHEDIRQFSPVRKTKFIWEGLDYIKVMFIRNPYEVVFSTWSGLLDFDDFIETEIECGLKPGLETNQLDYMLDNKGNMLVDFIGRFENLEEDWKKFTHKIGLENLELPYLNVGGDGGSGSSKAKFPCTDGLSDKWVDEGPGPTSPLYTNYYTPYSRSVVEHLFKEDFYCFEYEYGK